MSLWVPPALLSVFARTGVVLVKGLRCCCLLGACFVGRGLKSVTAIPAMMLLSPQPGLQGQGLEFGLGVLYKMPQPPQLRVWQNKV